MIMNECNIDFLVCTQPNRPDELMRIEEAGGRVINWNGHRVLGVLATSRSIGLYEILTSQILRFLAYDNVG